MTSRVTRCVIDQPLQRWLLLFATHLSSHRPKMTPEWIANALGARRRSVIHSAENLRSLAPSKRTAAASALSIVSHSRS